MATETKFNCVAAFGAAMLALWVAGIVPTAKAAPVVPPAPPVRKLAAVVDSPRPMPAPMGSSSEMRVVDLVNGERSRRGLAPLSPSPNLMNVSRSWSNTQANRGRMYHSKNGYMENVAYGQDSPESVMNAWMNSRGHRANILSSRATTIGVGCARSSNGRLYWTQCFQ
jgi:uncharacterized protein YkwD